MMMSDNVPNSTPFRFGLELPSDSEPRDYSKLRVLIVDDEPMLRSVIQDFLLMLGFENQRVAGDGLEALEVMRAEPIDFMLSDIRMPKMELEELLGVIKQEFPRLVVVATSGFSDLESARNIFVKGAHDFIGKPLNLDALELAMQWIVERQRLLHAAEQLFGKAALPVPPEEVHPRLAALRERLLGGTHHFETKIRHAIRMADLLGQIQTDLAEPQLTDLTLAALLHELGTGYQIQTLCHQPRSLDEDERRLVQEHAQISGRLIAWSLDRPEFQAIIGEHLQWKFLMHQPESEWSMHNRLAIWLGLINGLDGYLHDRPDRPAVSTAQVRSILQHNFITIGRTPVEILLEQWDRVKAFFASPQ
jgi:response regulator RpfG family c-di-GMP phosphodiesterase